MTAKDKGKDKGKAETKNVNAGDPRENKPDNQAEAEIADPAGVFDKDK